VHYMNNQVSEVKENPPSSLLALAKARFEFFLLQCVLDCIGDGDSLSFVLGGQNKKDLGESEWVGNVKGNQIGR